MSSQKTILVTGGSGVIASRCILEAFKRNLTVKTTTRSPRRIDETKEILRSGGATQQQIANVSFVPYNELFTDDDCAEAVLDCSLIIHTIPYGAWDVRHMRYEDSVSLAKDPVIKLLRAAHASVTKCKVVIINSLWAINGNEPSLGKGQQYTEADWSTLEPEGEAMSIIARRRNITVVAERAIWTWLSSEGHGLHVSVLNPPSTTGPFLSTTHVAAEKLITGLLAGKLSEGPDYTVGVVDQRDVADLAFRCLDDPSAAGERYIACADGDLVSLADIVKILKTVLPNEETKKLAYDVWAPWLLKTLKWTGIAETNLAREFPRSKRVSNQKARDLGWRPRSSHECITGTVQSLKEFGVLPSSTSETIETTEIIREKR